MEVNETLHLLDYADDISILGENIDTVRENTEVLLEARREVGLEVNTEKTKYMVTSRHQNACQNHSLLIDNKSYENLIKFRYL
jgi:hypothetical protein